MLIARSKLKSPFASLPSRSALRRHGITLAITSVASWVDTPAAFAAASDECAGDDARAAALRRGVDRWSHGVGRRDRNVDHHRVAARRVSGQSGIALAVGAFTVVAER